MSLESKLEELNINFGRLLDILAGRPETEAKIFAEGPSRPGTAAGLSADNLHNMARPQADIGINTPRTKVVVDEVSEFKSGKHTSRTDEKGGAEKKPEEQKESTVSGPEAGQDSCNEPTYDEVKKYILQISAKSRDKAVALLARYGAKGGPSLKQEQYGMFVKDALATLAGVYDPEKGE